MSDEADEPTSEIFFETHQWRVTAYGVESLEPGITYEIPAERFLKSSRGDVYDWPVHMAEKTWVDIEAFIEVFTKAVSLHAGKLNGAVDPAKLAASIVKAHQVKAHQETRRKGGRLTSIAR